MRQRAASHAATSAAERDAYEAVYAYEEALSTIRGRQTRAGRTWPLVKVNGILAVVESIVTRTTETAGFRVLVDMGLDDMLFESVVMRHPEAFSEKATRMSKLRLTRLNAGRGNA